MKTNNIIMGVLVAVIAVMGVAFAAFGTTLTVNGTATIDTNWEITFTAGSCTDTSKDSANRSSGTIKMESDGVTATVDASMKSPGDVLSCTVTATNSGDLDAIRKSWSVTSGADSTAYTVAATAPAASVLTAGSGSEILTITITYKSDVTSVPEAAEFKAVATYVQNLA